MLEGLAQNIETDPFQMLVNTAQQLAETGGHIADVYGEHGFSAGSGILADEALNMAAYIAQDAIGLHDFRKAFDSCNNLTLFERVLHVAAGGGKLATTVLTAKFAYKGLKGAPKSGLRRSATVSKPRAVRFLKKQGFSKADARAYVKSFSGRKVTIRIGKRGKSFLRYSGKPTGGGRFLSRTKFRTPADAVEGLYLKPYGNPATYMQNVTATGHSFIIEGGIWQGSPGVTQYFTTNPRAFFFGTGALY